MFVLRPYQRTAADRTHEMLKCARSVLAVMATGMGKTVYAVTVAHERQLLGRTMFLCHQDTLVRQAAKAFEFAFGRRPDIQMGEERGDIFSATSPVVVSTVQTQYSGYHGRGRKCLFDPNEFGTLIIDETHRYLAPKYREVVDHYMKNPRLGVIGLTATPDRRDKLAMGRLFERVACNYDIRYGVDHSWLVPVEQYTGRLTDMDLQEVERTKAGDLNPEQLSEVLCRTKNLHGVVDHSIKQTRGRRAVVFAVPGGTDAGDGSAVVKHAHLLTTIFNKRIAPVNGIPQASYIHQGTPGPERRAMLKAFAAGAFQFLVNVGVLTEGFDDAGVECVVMARPTTSRLLYTQMAGRATRPIPYCVDPYPTDEERDNRRVSIAESAKPCAEIIDFEGNAGRHKLISGADILGGDYETEVIARAKQRAAETESPKDLRELLDDAKREIDRERQRKAEQLAAIRMSSQCEFEYVDPYSHAGTNVPRQRKTAGIATGKRAGPPSAQQITFLERHAPKGTQIDRMNMGEAGAMVGEIKRRFRLKLCSVAQSNLLKKHGLPGDVPRDRAKQWIDRIASNRWNCPPDVRREAAEFSKVY